MNSIDPKDITQKAYEQHIANTMGLGRNMASDTVRTTDGVNINEVKKTAFYEPPLDPRLRPSPLKPGEFTDFSGSTVYKPLRSSPEVEAILGKEIYKSKPKEDTPEQVKLQMAEMQATINQLQTMIASMAGAVKSVEPVEETDKTGIDINELSMSELRKTAKNIGITAPVGTKKENLINMILEKENNA